MHVHIRWMIRRDMPEVRESNLPAQQFFRAMGFRAVTVLRQFYEDTPEDAYLMRLKVRSQAGHAHVPGETR